MSQFEILLCARASRCVDAAKLPKADVRDDPCEKRRGYRDSGGIYCNIYFSHLSRISAIIILHRYEDMIYYMRKFTFFEKYYIWNILRLFACHKEEFSC